MDVQWFHYAVLMLSILFSLYNRTLLSIAFVLIVVLAVLREWTKRRWCLSPVRLDGKLAIVTEGSTGHGRETAVGLATRGARVILACKDSEEGEAACRYVEQKTGSSLVEFSKLDLSKFASVRKFSRHIAEKETKLDILVFTGGMEMTDKTFTEDGQELVFQVNHLSPFLLTNLLFGFLKASDASRVVSTTSAAYSWLKSETNFNDVTWSKTPYDKKLAFAQSKLANILFTRELAARTAETSVRTFCVDPGSGAFNWMTYFDNKVAKNIVSFAKHLFLKSEDEEAQGIIFCCVEETINNQSGRLYMECEERALEDFALDKALSENLWNVSEDIVGDITGLGEARIETVKIVELVETADGIMAKARDDAGSSSDSEDKTNDHNISLTKGNIETTMRNLMTYEEGNSESTVGSNLQTTTVTRRVVKTIISSSHVSASENNLTITEM